jgi:hypothetical protein
MRRLLFLVTLAVAMPARAVSLNDAQNVTGATTGKVIAMTTTFSTLTAAQKSALATFVQSLGTNWPGQPGNIWNISLSRVDGSPGTISIAVTGFIVHADASTAVTQLSSGATQGIVGIVP